MVGLFFYRIYCVNYYCETDKIMKNKLYKVLGGLILGGTPVAVCYPSFDIFGIMYIAMVIAILLFIVGYASVGLMVD